MNSDPSRPGADEGPAAAAAALLSRLLSDPAATSTTARAPLSTSVHIDSAGTARVELDDGDQVHTCLLPDVERCEAALDELATLGRVASSVLAEMSKMRRDRREQDEQHRRAERAARYAHATADTYGLQVAGDSDTWVVPGLDVAHQVRAVDPPQQAWSTTYLAALEISVDGTVLGEVRVDADERVTVAGAFEYARLDESVLGRDRARALAHARPAFRSEELTDRDPVADHIRHLVGTAPQTREWVIAMAEAVALIKDADAARELERTQWAKLSRSKDRIPNGPLNAWMKDMSSIDYLANGAPAGGWTVIAETLVGRTRPRHLEGRGRGAGRAKPVGLAQVYYAVRLVYADHRGRRDPGSFHSFYDSQVAKLREALPGCVIRVPEDAKAVFVAFDKPEYVQALDAALVEWVLAGPVE